MPRDLRTSLVEWNAARARREERTRRLDAELDWKAWARRRFAVYWYGILVLFGDIALFATIVSSFPRPTPSLAYAVSVAFLAPVGYFEWELYRHLWPSEDAVLEAETLRVRGDAGPPPAARKVPRREGPRGAADPPTASAAGPAVDRAGGRGPTRTPPAGEPPAEDADSPASEEA